MPRASLPAALALYYDRAGSLIERAIVGTLFFLLVIVIVVFLIVRPLMRRSTKTRTTSQSWSRDAGSTGADVVGGGSMPSDTGDNSHGSLHHGGFGDGGHPGGHGDGGFSGGDGGGHGGGGDGGGASGGDGGGGGGGHG